MARIHRQRLAISWIWATAGCIAIVLLCGMGLSAQCQMCRTALTQSVEGQRWSHGINAGILLLLAAPFLIAGGSLLVICRAQLVHTLGRIRARLILGRPVTVSE
jgi:hypothetical protein